MCAPRTVHPYLRAPLPPRPAHVLPPTSHPRTVQTSATPEHAWAGVNLRTGATVFSVGVLVTAPETVGGTTTSTVVSMAGCTLTEEALSLA